MHRSLSFLRLNIFVLTVTALWPISPWDRVAHAGGGFPIASKEGSVTYPEGSGLLLVSGYKTAKYSLAQSYNYEWSLQQNTPPNQIPYIIRPGMTVSAPFTITATRSNGSTTKSNGPLKGMICVTNEGIDQVEVLRIHDVLQIKRGNSYEDIAWQPLLIREEIDPGMEKCFPYQFNRTLDPSKTYRNVAWVSLRSSAVPQPWNHTKGDSLPHSQTLRLETPVEFVSEINDTDPSAFLLDTFQCPEGFECKPSTYSEILSDSKAISYSVELKNISAPCGQTLTALNSVTLTGSSSQSVLHGASSQIRIFTGTCR